MPVQTTDEKENASILGVIPRYAALPLLVVVAWNMTVYFGNRIFSTGLHHYDFTTALDNRIPFVPWTVIIYLGCYLFWVVNYILSCRDGRDKTLRFTSADVIGKTVCLLFYILLPTTNIRPEVTGSDIFSSMMVWLYSTDAADNLLPSIHCLVSWLCFIGVKNSDNVPGWWKKASFIIAVAICISTLTTKQHVMVDVVSGILLAEICYAVAGKFPILSKLPRI